jgi:ribosomal subunit interface protein
MNRNQNSSSWNDLKQQECCRKDRFAGPLEILIHANGMPVTDQLRDAIQVKIGRLRHYNPTALRARVRLRKSRSEYRANVLYELKGNDVVAEHVANNPLTALDLVSDKVERRLRRRKTAQLARRTKSGRPASVLTQPVLTLERTR